MLLFESVVAPHVARAARGAGLAGAAFVTRNVKEEAVVAAAKEKKLMKFY